MMSNKWTFSLTILITLLALAFVATPAMAGDFATTITVAGNDVSHADNEQRPTGTSIVFNVSFGKVVEVNTTAGLPAGTGSTEAFEPADLIVRQYDELGAVIPLTGTPVTLAPGTPANGQNYTATVTISDDARSIYFQVPKGKVGAADPTVGDDDDENEKKDITVGLIPVDAVAELPTVYQIALAGEPFSTITTETFQIQVLLSEKPKEAIKDILDTGESTFVSVAELASPVPGPTFPAVDLNSDGDTTDPNEGAEITTAVSTTKTGDMLRLYLVTLKAKPGEKTVLIKVKDFSGMARPVPGSAQDMYIQGSATTLVEGRQQLTVKTKTADPQDPKAAGTEVPLTKDEFIPGSGYMVVVESLDASEILKPPGDNEPKPHQRDPGELLYNVQDLDIPNLETFLSNGGVIDVKSPIPLVITEVMWGSDQSLAPNVANSQWIELYNPGGQHKIAENTIYLVFYTHSERPPARNADGTLPSGIVDRIGTLNDAGSGLWSLAGKGQSGRTGHDEGKTDALTAAIPYTNIVSMFRVNAGTGWADGQMAASWTASTPPSDNFDPNQPGHRTGSPGAATDMSGLEDAAAAEAKAKADAAAAAEAKIDSTGTVPQAGNIYISEVMFAGGGSLPQWIEIANSSRTEEVNLSGWTLTIDNAAGDADVSVGGSITFTIPAGTMIGMYGQNDSPSTILVVTEPGRNNIDATGQVLNLWTANQTELILAGVTKRRYSLLSDMAFEITLAPPAPTATKLAATATPAQKADAKAADATAMAAHKAATDMAGNLGADGSAAWALPMSEEGQRSSIIRRHIPVNIGPAEPYDGTMMDGWRLASDTSFAQPQHVLVESYYGAANDSGTPGFRAGGALPVELSSFRPARDKATGAVVITWSTQSELNNAGFFIKRSQQRDGEFKVINAAMVPGAGTTSEKQFYTYPDTTAQPNVVYYYQIEDVSLDGQRQTLTRGIRLKGHIGAAGKLTATWGELKSSNE